MLKPPIRILIVAALCIAALIAMVARESMARESGAEVKLPMAAIDPRALLQGHYVIVALQENLPPETPCPQALGQNMLDERQWLALAQSGAHHSVIGQAQTRDEARALGQIAVRGAATCYKPDPVEGEPPLAGMVQANLGIDRFHISQAEAERIERMLREPGADAQTRVYAIVSIGGDGRARMLGLEADGERLMLNWW